MRYPVAATIVTTLKKLWADSWGPRLEHILRNTLLSLSYYSESTLLDIVPMLTNYEFRKQVLYAVPVLSILDFWYKEFEPLSPQLKNEFILFKKMSEIEQYRYDFEIIRLTAEQVIKDFGTHGIEINFSGNGLLV